MAMLRTLLNIWQISAWVGLGEVMQHKIPFFDENGVGVFQEKRYTARPSCFNALVAQLDRVLVSEAKGRGFDSRRAHQIKSCDLLNRHKQSQPSE
jgi:hypothetical protein